MVCFIRTLRVVLYAVSEGNTDQSVCKNTDIQTCTRRRPSGTRESGNDDKDQGMRQMRPLYDEVSYLASYSCTPGKELLRLLRQPRRKNKGSDTRRKNMRQYVKNFHRGKPLWTNEDYRGTTPLICSILRHINV